MHGVPIPSNRNPTSYKDAGVDIDAGEALVEAIKPLARSTRRAGADASLGGFGALFDLKAAGYRDPILVATNDGVGTKVKIAIDSGRNETVGIDLVAMCVNDCLCLGAEPLFFLDYIALGKDNPLLLEQLVSGVSNGCQQAGAALLGGETAIMPDLYAAGDFDMAGFCVGVAERSDLVDGRYRVHIGDVLIGVPSSGFHSNGYSLVRKAVFSHAGLQVSDFIPELNATVGQALLTPTRIYASTVTAARNAATPGGLHAIAHITGGGIADNLVRVLPEYCQAVIDRKSWTPAPVFPWLQKLGGISDSEMFSVFNMGIGMIFAVPAECAQAVLTAVSTAEHPAVILGSIRKQQQQEASVELVG